MLKLAKPTQEFHIIQLLDNQLLLNNSGFLILQLPEVRNNGKDTLTITLPMSTGLLKPTTIRSELHTSEELDLFNLKLKKVQNGKSEVKSNGFHMLKLILML
jgi:hypothetical protein